MYVEELRHPQSVSLRKLGQAGHLLEVGGDRQGMAVALLGEVMC